MATTSSHPQCLRRSWCKSKPQRQSLEEPLWHYCGQAEKRRDLLSLRAGYTAGRNHTHTTGWLWGCPHWRTTFHTAHAIHPLYVYFMVLPSPHTAHFTATNVKKSRLLPVLSHIILFFFRFIYPMKSPIGHVSILCWCIISYWNRKFWTGNFYFWLLFMKLICYLLVVCRSIRGRNNHILESIWLDNNLHRAGWVINNSGSSKMSETVNFLNVYFW